MLGAKFKADESYENCIDAEGFLHADFAPPYLRVWTPDYGTVGEDFKQAMQGVEVVYRLETPIEHPISYVEDAFINVGGCSKVRFVNEHAKSVPNTMVFMLKGDNV